MRALDYKLLRDLWGMKSQAVAIALVIASGVATFIMSAGTYDALRLTQATFYRESRFAEVFCSLKRAPESLRSRIEAIPGVQTVETRVVAAANLDLENYPDPVVGQVVSVPDHGKPLLNQIYLRRGRMVEAARDDEILLGEAFANAHGFQPGDRIFATINGRRKQLRVAGIALSPEFIYQLAPGTIIPDFKGYGVFWMARTPLGTAYNMEGAFNDVALTLSSEGRAEDVIDALDDLLRDYGGQGAYTRQDQLSNRYLSEEFRQLQQMATLFPLIFLSVAAFLLNVVVGRLIATQREQVAILKAFGYSNHAVVIHYLKLVVLVVLLGAAVGMAFGMWLGKGMSNMYMEFYRFPYLVYRLRPGVAVSAVLISAAAALAGTVYSVVRAAMQPPAQGMRPAPPGRYRVSLVERIGIGRWLGQPTRMIVRNLERRPGKALLSVLGIAAACAILMVGGFWRDAVEYMIAVQFRLSQRDDVTVTFVEPTSRKAMYALASLEGVRHVEPYRTVPARLRFEHRTYRTYVRGVPQGNTLYRLLDQNLAPVDIPANGAVVTDYLAKILGVRPGDLLTVEVLEGDRPVRQLPVAGLVREFVGVGAYMQMDALNRMMREGSAISGAYLTADARLRPKLYAELKRMPRIAGASVREAALLNFRETWGRQVLTFAFFNTLLAGTIAVGVVYNGARIALSERSRELASLRVLGFTRGEISYILLGELAILTLAAVPLGFVLGRSLCAFMIERMQSDLFRVPLVLTSWTYSFAATVVLAAGLASGLLVRRRLDHLDLVAVLKTQE